MGALHQVLVEIAGGLGVALIVWLFSMARQDRKTFQGLQDDMEKLKTNHLPHIYYTLGLICKKLGIDYEGDHKL